MSTGFRSSVRTSRTRRTGSVAATVTAAADQSVALTPTSSAIGPANAYPTGMSATPGFPP